MSRALSVDLRARVLGAVAAGATHREAAERFGVSAASVSRWRKRERDQGDPRPGRLGGDRRSDRIEAHHDAARSRFRLRHDPALLRPARHHAQKKTAHATELDRPDVLTRREEWFEDQLDLEPDRLVVIDETWASTNMARRQGRCRRGERLRVGVPHGHVWTPPRAQAESWDSRSRDRVLPCVRPLMRRVCAAGPYGSTRIETTSLERARSAHDAAGSLDPAVPTLRHTYPSTFTPPTASHPSIAQAATAGAR